MLTRRGAEIDWTNFTFGHGFRIPPVKPELGGVPGVLPAAHSGVLPSDAGGVVKSEGRASTDSSFARGAFGSNVV